MEFQSETLHTTNLQLNLKIVAINANSEKITNLQTLTSTKYTKASADLEAVIQIRDKMQIELNQKNNILKLKESESKRLYTDNAVLIKNREVLQKKLVQMEGIKADFTQELLKSK